MRAPATKRGRRIPVALAAAAFAIAGALLAIRAEGGSSRAEQAPAVAPAVAQSAAASAPAAQLPAAAAPAAPAAASRAAGAPATDDELVERERAEVDVHPEAAVALADEGEARFPSGPHADERAFLKMRALVHLGEIGVARAAAAQFFERHPESPLGRDVFRLTGMRPPPVLGPRT